MVSSKNKAMTMGYHTLKPVEMGDSVFGDDVAIMANTETSLQFNINLWAKKLERNKNQY